MGSTTRRKERMGESFQWPVFYVSVMKINLNTLFKLFPLKKKMQQQKGNPKILMF